MEWAASAYWNLLYLAATILSFCMAYYSRHEQVQKIAGYLAITYPIGMIAFHTPYHEIVFILIDLIGVAWCARVYSLDLSEPCSAACLGIFVVMLLSHFAPNIGLVSLIAYNLLYLAQLAMLCIYGKRYGIIARAKIEPRTDPYYRALIACRLMSTA